MTRVTGTGQNTPGGSARHNMGINIIPPNINKKKGPTGINALYREITRQYMEEFYRAVADGSFFDYILEDCEHEEYPDDNNIPPANDNTSDDIYSKAPQNDVGYELPPNEYYDKMADDEQYYINDIQMDYGSEPEPPEMDLDAYSQTINYK